jgi:AcrR family transcriptional regulator
MSIPGQLGGSLPDPTVAPRVIEAVLDELAACGRDGLSMDRIANRAGVSKVTIYRRWRTKDDLLVAAYQQLSRPFPELATGTLTGDLDALLDVVLDGAADHRYPVVLTELVAAAATDPTLRPHLHTVSDNWQTGIRQMLAAAQDRNELDADVAIDLLAEIISALTLRRIMFATTPIDHTLRTDIDTLLRHPPRRT